MSSTSFRKPESRLLFSYPALAGVTVGVAAVAALLLALPAEQPAPPDVSAPLVEPVAALAPAAPEPGLRPRAAPPLRLARSERPQARPPKLVPAIAARAPLVTASTRSVPWVTAAPRRADLPELRLAELTTARVRMVDAATPLHRPRAATAVAPAAPDGLRPMRRPQAESRAALPLAVLPELGRPRRRPNEPAVVVASLAPASAAVAGLAAAVPAPPARPAALKASAARAPAPKPVAARPAPKVASPAPAPVRVAPVVVERRSAPAPVRQKVVHRAPAKTPSAALAGAAATERVGLARGRVSLIGVFGGASDRHALLLLPNGNVERVQPGDRVQGVQVAAIGDDSVRLRRGGRDTLLRLPD